MQQIPVCSISRSTELYFDTKCIGFAYAGDSQWFIETTAQWYTVKTFREDRNLFVEAGAILANYGIALETMGQMIRLPMKGGQGGCTG